MRHGCKHMMHLVLSENVKNTMQACCWHDGMREECLVLPEVLSVGKIADMRLDARAAELARLAGINLTERQRKDRRICEGELRSSTEVCAWITSQEEEEVGLCYAASLLPIDATLMMVNLGQALLVPDLGAVADAFRNCWESRRPANIESLKRTWERLAQENAELRVREEGAIVSRGVNYYDNELSHELIRLKRNGKGQGSSQVTSCAAQAAMTVSYHHFCETGSYALFSLLERRASVLEREEYDNSAEPNAL